MLKFILNAMQFDFNDLISKIKFLEAENSALAEKAERNEHKFNALFVQASDGIFIADKNRNYIEVNENACKMLGYSRKELMKLNLEDIVLHEDLENLSFRFNETNLGNNVLIQSSLVRKDGSVIPVEISGKLVSDSRMVIIARDISERKMIEAELNAAKVKAEQSDRLKTSFLQNISHEIRTPMNAIIGFSDLLPEYFDDEKRLIKYTDLIKQRSLDLLEILERILDIAKIESGQLPHNPDICVMDQLFDFVESLFNEYRNKSANHNVEFELKVTRKVKALEVWIDQKKLKQILINLIENAYKFTSSGKIEVGCYVHENYVFTFYVSDTGIGIPKDKHTEIFTRFTQAVMSTTHLYGGTGLGLSIVQGLLKIMGGEIWLESDQGKGSTFFFTLPFKSNQQIQTFLETDIFEIAKDQHNIKILIVENDEFNSEYLTEILSDIDCTLTKTRLGLQAVEICKNQEIDLILTDIRLPDISGFELVKMVKKVDPGIKIIAQTAYSTFEDKQKAMKSGCDDYLRKPVGREVLMTRIENLLSQFKN